MCSSVQSPGLYIFGLCTGLGKVYDKGAKGKHTVTSTTAVMGKVGNSCVGSCLDRKLDTLSEFSPVKENLARIRNKTKFHNISLISAHSLTEERDDAVKDSFYAKLEDLYDKCSS